MMETTSHTPFNRNASGDVGSGNKVDRAANNGRDAVPASITNLPTSYGVNTIFLVAQAPNCLFTYWDINIPQHPDSHFFIRCMAKGNIESEIRVKFETRSWHIPVFRSGTIYSTELGYYLGNQWNVIVRSAPAQTPLNQPSTSDNFEYATLPLCLSFQALLMYIQSAVNPEEKLIQALARLQRRRKTQLNKIDADFFSEDEWKILEVILGKDFLSSLVHGRVGLKEWHVKQQYLEKKYRKKFQGKIPTTGWGNKESGLFAALLALLNHAHSSWSSSALTDWLQLSQKQTEQSFSSWWDASGGSSWHRSALTGTGEESAFYLHVDAEVLFHGSTQPHSSITIDSKPVDLNPDGSFLFRFAFPDGAYEIPIVATSPDGLETRSAVLRFHRAQSGDTSAGRASLLSVLAQKTMETS